MRHSWFHPLGIALRWSMASIWILSVILLIISWDSGYVLRFSRNRLVFSDGSNRPIDDATLALLPDRVPKDDHFTNLFLGVEMRHGEILAYWHYTSIYPATASLPLEHYTDYGRPLLVICEFQSGDVRAPVGATFRGWQKLAVGNFVSAFASNDFFCFPAVAWLMLMTPSSILVFAGAFGSKNKRGKSKQRGHSPLIGANKGDIHL